MATFALGTIHRMLINDGEDHTSLVLRRIVETGPSLPGDVIRFCFRRTEESSRPFSSCREAIDWFGVLSLVALRSRAQRLATGQGALATLIADRMIAE